MRKYLVGILLLSNFIHAQDKVSSLNYDIKGVKKFYDIVDETNKKVVFVFKEKTQTDFIALDNNLTQEGKISLNNESKEDYDLIGYSISNQKYYTYWDKSD